MESSIEDWISVKFSTEVERVLSLFCSSLELVLGVGLMTVSEILFSLKNSVGTDSMKFSDGSSACVVVTWPTGSDELAAASVLPGSSSGLGSSSTEIIIGSTCVASSWVVATAVKESPTISKNMSIVLLSGQSD